MDFLGLKFFIPGFFGVGKFSKYLCVCVCVVLFK